MPPPMSSLYRLGNTRAFHRSSGSSSHHVPKVVITELTKKLDGYKKVGRVAGVHILAHPSLALLPLISGTWSYFSQGNAMDYVNHATYLAAITGSVLLHECGHALMARILGDTPAIIAFNLAEGLMLSTRNHPPAPKRDRWMAAAGPATNLLIAGSLLLIDNMMDQNTVMQPIAWMNLCLVFLSLRGLDGRIIFRSFF